ncbi:hypothetical protein G6F37_004207 [Rhizopus arrhizus]|nr:hypothetical protein G6F38_008296 [Rhizopus arrhizus]KAG1160193.1 hypothetical protein G6F37_004207 [Rhizopus arrhizus]
MAGTVFKSKLHTIINKLSNKHNDDDKQKQTDTVIYSTKESSQDSSKRKLSDTSSVGTHDSATTIADKFRQAMPFFRTKSASTLEGINSTDFSKELERLHSLYILAADELNFAEDSVGSFYYSGDLLAAREALDDCANAFMQLLEHILDPVSRESVRSSMTTKLVQLQARLAHLPADEPLKNNDELGYYSY